MIPARTVVLDNEAVQALADAAHRKHRRVLAIVNLVATRNARRDAPAVQLVVPTAVRVEAGWHRRARKAATINRLRIDDLVLDTAAADSAVEVRSTLAVSVADAHIAACLGRTPGPHAVVTSDVEDLRRIAGHLDVDVRVLAI